MIRRHLAPGGSALLQLGTTEQADVLADEELHLADALTLSEVRQQERGVLVRIDRDAASAE